MKTLRPFRSPQFVLYLFDYLIRTIIQYGVEGWSPNNLNYNIIKSLVNKQVAVLSKLWDTVHILYDKIYWKKWWGGKVAFKN